MSENPNSSHARDSSHAEGSSSKYLDLDVEQVEFSVRTINCMKKSHVRTVGELVQFAEMDLTRAGFGCPSIEEIKEILLTMDLRLHVAGAPPCKLPGVTAEEARFDTDVVGPELVAMLDSLSDLVERLQPRLAYLISDALTPGQRRTFRSLAGGERIFDLSNRVFRLNQLMNALCSEKARELIAVKSQAGGS